ncbi:hypothetical protein N7519_005114 [Penicillium mononematosum]|nr:uncharacterized protein N7519_005114 [Penicillium mononematosum]KAJ6183813.1 hypothetical protein N7519_005114 [Penicillium mononematosum]
MMERPRLCIVPFELILSPFYTILHHFPFAGVNLIHTTIGCGK